MSQFENGYDADTKCTSMQLPISLITPESKLSKTTSTIAFIKKQMKYNDLLNTNLQIAEARTIKTTYSDEDAITVTAFFEPSISKTQRICANVSKEDKQHQWQQQMYNKSKRLYKRHKRMQQEHQQNNRLKVIQQWHYNILLQFLRYCLCLLLLLATTSNALLIIETPNESKDSIINSNYNNNHNNGSKNSYKTNSSNNISHFHNNLAKLDSNASNNTNNKKSSSSDSSSINYMDKFANLELERSVAAVLIKVAYGTTSTTKRSIPDNNYVPSLTTIATPLLTTLRYLDKSSSSVHQQQTFNQYHRSYELDLERDHALPTSAPNADILKSNSNPIYPNPNRHHNNHNNNNIGGSGISSIVGVSGSVHGDSSLHERDRYRHLLNSTPLPSLPNIHQRYTTGGHSHQQPTLPILYNVPSQVSGGLIGGVSATNLDLQHAYTPPRSFFTPPLPPEYQNPFHDKPILRGTNNEDVVTNSGGGAYINRRPIPPPSLMPGHERIPFRPPDIAAASTGDATAANSSSNKNTDINIASKEKYANQSYALDAERKKLLNTPYLNGATDNDKEDATEKQQPTEQRKEVLPSIRRILSGSNGNKGEIPDVLLKQVTSRPVMGYHEQPPLSPVVLIQRGSNSDTTDVLDSDSNDRDVGAAAADANTNINQRKVSGDETFHIKTHKISQSTQRSIENNQSNSNAGNSLISTAIAASSAATAAASITTTTTSTTLSNSFKIQQTTLTNNNAVTSSSTSSSTTSMSAAAAAAATTTALTQTTWSIAWHIHVYLSVTLFTILMVCSCYKILIYNKLTHLFTQSYFIAIHLILIIISTMRIFYLCYDAYNIHSTFSIFISELLLNLPATFLTISFAILILYLFRKSLNHKHNRYSALIRPLTVVVGCGVHVLLCITLHYVESYTLQQQQHKQQLHLQQQQNLLYRRQQQQLLQQQGGNTQYAPAYAIKQQQPQQYQQTAYLLSVAAASAAAHVATMNGLGQGHTNMSYLPSGANTPIVGGTGPATASAAAAAAAAAAASNATLPPPRVLSLICQIIYIFVCLILGLLYLYLYRLLKRILRSKSQNYIHGYQNLSYAIHITIAAALLFVLLAVLQIFGAIGISNRKPIVGLMTTAAATGGTSYTNMKGSTSFNGNATTTLDIDWLQWGYQFSLRLIEIAIITLISWVVGLKMNGSGSGGSNSNVDGHHHHHHQTTNGMLHMTNGASTGTNGSYGTNVRYDANADSIFGGTTGFGQQTIVARDKYNQSHQHQQEQYHHSHQQQQHNNVANFFLPCTASTRQQQQEPYEMDYSGVCQANTNLHTYTMRTGKLIYDDGFTMNSLNNTMQQQKCKQSTYQRPYDTTMAATVKNTSGHDELVNAESHYNCNSYGEYATAQSIIDNRNKHENDDDDDDDDDVQLYQQRQQPYHHHQQHQYADYLTDSATDHYENPNFDLYHSALSNDAAAVGGNNSGNNNKHDSNHDARLTSHNNNKMNTEVIDDDDDIIDVTSSTGNNTDGYYAEPMLPPTNSIHSTHSSTSTSAISNYDFNTFERPKYSVDESITAQQQVQHQQKKCSKRKSNTLNNWCDSKHPLMRLSDATNSRGNVNATNGLHLEHISYEHPERCSTSSTHSHTSATGISNAGDDCDGDGGVAGNVAACRFNSFDRGYFYHSGGARKSNGGNNRNTIAYNNNERQQNNHNCATQSNRSLIRSNAQAQQQIAVTKTAKPGSTIQTQPPTMKTNTAIAAANLLLLERKQTKPKQHKNCSAQNMITVGDNDIEENVDINEITLTDAQKHPLEII